MIARGEGGAELSSGGHSHSRLTSQEALEGLAGIAAREAYGDTPSDELISVPQPVEGASMRAHSSLSDLSGDVSGSKLVRRRDGNSSSRLGSSVMRGSSLVRAPKIPRSSSGPTTVRGSVRGLSRVTDFKNRRIN